MEYARDRKEGTKEEPPCSGCNEERSSIGMSNLVPFDVATSELIYAVI